MVIFIGSYTLYVVIGSGMFALLENRSPFLQWLKQDRTGLFVFIALLLWPIISISIIFHRLIYSAFYGEKYKGDKNA
jgi:hypothetical protein